LDGWNGGSWIDHGGHWVVDDLAAIGVYRGRRSVDHRCHVDRAARELMGILRALMEQRSLANPEPWLIEALGGGRSAAGVSVSAESALRNMTVAACVRILAETVSSLPLLVYRRRERGKERAPDHPLYRILHDQPNSEMSSFEFRETLMGHLALWGNAYAEIERDGGGRVAALWPLRPDRMKVTRENGALVYRYRLSAGEEVALPQRNVFHVRGLSGDGIVGYSPIRLAREAIGLALATEEFGARFFGSGARPGAVLQHPGKLNEEAQKRLRQSLEDAHGGLSRAHRLMILEEGMTWQQIGIPPEDAQFLQTRSFQVEEIARFYRVPLVLLQHTEKSTSWGTGIEQFMIAFIVHTIRPWLVRWEQAIQRNLFLYGERDTYFAEFLVDGLLRGDVESRYRAYATARQWGWLSANDIRELENMNPIPGGDIYLSPMNMAPVGQEASTSDEQRFCGCGYEYTHESTTVGEQRTALRRSVAASYRGILRKTIERILRRERADVLREAERYFGKRATIDPTIFRGWLTEFYTEHEQFVLDQMTPVYEGLADAVSAAALDEVGQSEVDRRELVAFIGAYSKSFARRHVGRSVERLLEALEEDDPLQGLREEFDSWEDSEQNPGGRAGDEADEEAVRFPNAVALKVFALVGITKIMWVASGNSCPMCKALNGKVVGVERTFAAVGDVLDAGEGRTPFTVSSNIKHPPLHKGCDCTIIPA
jgi:HK97 family phage portal protein